MDEKPENERTLRSGTRNFLSLVQPYRGTFFLILFIVLCNQSLIVLERYLFKIVVDNSTAYSTGLLTKEALLSILLIVAAVFLANVLVGAVLRWLHIHFINLLEVNIIADLKRKFFNHIVGLSYNFHTTHKTGSLISKVSRGGRAVENMMDAIVFNFAPLAFQLLIASVAIFTMSAPTAIAIVLTVAAFVAFSMYIQKRQYPHRTRANDVEDLEKAGISDYLTNIESIKYFGKEEAIRDRFFRLSEETKQSYRRMWNFFRNMDFGTTLIIGIGTIVVVTIPIRSFLDGEISIGTVVFIYSGFVALLSPLYSFVYGVRSYYQASADFESLYQYEAITNDIKDRKDAGDMEIRKGEVAFRSVTFSYKDRMIIDRFSLRIKPKEKIALVGHSGSGKTTLVRLLYRLYDPGKGAILIDGKGIKDCRQQSLRAAMSIVPQEAVLFDDTIYSNIAFSRPGASREDVLAAIRFAQLDRIIARFPMGENTIVGERGVRLSGGEKQRVSIARAILADKRVLVLDEATSSLDSKTESEIQRDLWRLMKDRTTIIIAHRLSTVMRADRIIVLDKGRIVQQGTHQQLIKKRGLYRVLWELQKGGYLDDEEDD